MIVWQGPCELKVRVYQHSEPQSFVVEFLRRGGDAVAYSAVFGQAADFFRERLSGAISVEQAALPTQPDRVAEAPGEDFNVDLGPLFDMASTVEHPGAQAEAAPALL